MNNVDISGRRQLSHGVRSMEQHPGCDRGLALQTGRLVDGLLGALGLLLEKIAERDILRFGFRGEGFRHPGASSAASE